MYIVHNYAERKKYNYNYNYNYLQQLMTGFLKIRRNVRFKNKLFPDVWIFIENTSDQR